jgi:hypothetical protein
MTEATNLANHYGTHAAIDDSSCSVKPVIGEVLDLVGADEIADRRSGGCNLGNGTTPRPRVVRAAGAAGADGLTNVPGVNPPLVLPAPSWAPRRPVSGPRSATVRVAHVTDFDLPRPGAIERHVCDLARAQREFGFDVDVITGGGRVEGNIYRSTSRAAWVARSRVGAVSDPRCATCGARGSYHVVHLHGGIATPLAYSVASAVSHHSVPTVVTLHSMLGGLSPWFGAADALFGWRRSPVEWIAARLGCRPGMLKSRHAGALA